MWRNSHVLLLQMCHCIWINVCKYTAVLEEKQRALPLDRQAAAVQLTLSVWTVIYRHGACVHEATAAMTPGSGAERSTKQSGLWSNNLFHVRVSCKSRKEERNREICTAKKSLWIGAANGLEALWFSVRYSDLMSCNACQEQHLLKRCLSDGQICAGTNTDSLRSDGLTL